MAGVHSVPGLRRGDPHRDLLHDRDRVTERPLPAGGPRQRSLPDRAGGDEVPLPGHQITGPDRARTSTMDRTLEASTQRIALADQWPAPET